MADARSSEGSLDHGNSPKTRPSVIKSLLVLLPIFGVLISASFYLHYTLPEPQNGFLVDDGFSETIAMDYIRYLASYDDGSPRYRIVGTQEMVETETYVLEQIDSIKKSIYAAVGDAHEVEVWHQTGTGSHLFDFMDKKVWKKYYNMTNVIVRLSDGTPQSKANSVLINAHLDSTLPSPGAADDLVGVAVMLEVLRVMGRDASQRLSNSVVFLFNGGEESLQDASHLFITQHPLRHTVRAVINVEACGVGGPEIVFQATSEEMIRAMAYMPRPYGTILATEIFSTGLVVSDTDFRQFVDYGNLSGIDMALVQNSYFYHTRLDVPDRIEPGAMQHMGNNLLAMLTYLTSPATALGNSLEAKALPTIEPSSVIFFSSLGGYLYFVYTRSQASIAYGAIFAAALVVFTHQAGYLRRNKAVYALAAASVFASYVAALLGAVAAAAITQLVARKPLSYFRHEQFPILLYGPPAALFALLVQKALVSCLSSHPRAPLEHALLYGQLAFFSFFTVVGHSFGIGSVYLFATSAASALAAVLVNDFVLACPGEVHLASYAVGQAAPFLLGVEGLVGFLDFFVPLMGRTGADAPVDFIVAAVVAVIGFLTVPSALPLAHRFGRCGATWAVRITALASVAVLLLFLQPRWAVYDAEHPRRILALHMENMSRPDAAQAYHLHMASVDCNPFDDVVAVATAGLLDGAVDPPALARIDDDTADWDIIFPVSQFLASYRVPLPAGEAPVASAAAWQDLFTVSAQNVVLNAIARTRSLDLVMRHPGIIWPVVAFSADVRAWDLPEPAARGLQRHHVKSVAGYGVSEFRLSLVLQLTEAEFQAAMREDQRRKGQRADSSDADRALGSLRVDFSGLDEMGMYPASIHSIAEKKPQQVAGIERPGLAFFEKLEKQMPEDVDAMFLSAIAGVAYV